MRILHVTSGLDRSLGGPVRQLLGMVPALQRRGLKISVMSSFAGRAPIAEADELRHSGCEVEIIGPTWTALAWHPKLHRQLRLAIGTADVVHIHGVWEQIQHLSARLSFTMGRPYVMTPHGMLDPWSLAQKALKKRLYLWLRLRRNLEQASAIHYTDAVEAELAGALRLHPSTIVEPCFVDTSEFAALGGKTQMRRELVQLFPQIGDHPVILYFGRIHAKKGLDVLIPAFAQATTNDARLLIVGPNLDGYMAQVRQMVQSHQLKERVIEGGMMVGRDRLAALAGSDLFVLPSYQENFGIAVVEALAAGTPVIISDRVNIHRYITEGGVGEVVTPTVAPLASALTRWINDASLRSQAAAKAREFIAQQFNLEVVANHWVDHYHRLAQISRTDDALDRLD